ncbi:FtsX-like permease family protein [Streptomyces sp. 7R007]
MLLIAVRTLRTRWVSFVGGFVALALGVGLVTVMGLALAAASDTPERHPERFAAAGVVVRGQDTLRVGAQVRDLPAPRPVPASTVAALRRLGEVTEDRSFAVRVQGGPRGLVGHPWSTAAFAPYGLRAGRAPRAADEVVATGAWTRPGRLLRTDSGTVRVVGTVRALPFEQALFYTDARAARLSPVSTQLVVRADAAAVRRVVGKAAEVLTGDARRRADADPDRDREAVTALNALFGTAGGVAAFVSVFVVASTFAYTVTARRREFGLLRATGATPGQVRRSVCAEALLVGALASATGCALGGYAAPCLAARVVDGGLAPAWFAIGDHAWPYHLAFWTGLLVALGGALTASWRAGRTAPTEALREASAATRPLAPARLVTAPALLVTAAVTLALTLLTDPSDLLHRKTYVSRPLLLITGVALLSPALIRPSVRLLARLPGAVGMLVRENAATAVHRTAAVAAPVLVTVALTGSLLGATATVTEAKATEARARTTADYVLTTPDASTPFVPSTLRRLRAIPGAVVSPTASTALYVVEDGVALVRSEARAVTPRALAATTHVPLAAGRLTALDDESIVVNEEWATHTVGHRVTVRLADGSRRSLRIAAVMPTGTGDNGAYVTPANAPGARTDRVDVTVRPGADARAVGRALRAATAGTPAEVLPRQRWLSAHHPASPRTTRLGLLLTLGLALLYTAVSLANTVLMTTTDRRAELTALRLAGATPSQVLRLTTTESLTAVTIGALLGLLITTVDLLGMHTALTLLSAPTPFHMPWLPLAAATAACASLAVATVLPSTALTLRHGSTRH